MDTTMNRKKIIAFLKTAEDDLDSDVYDYVVGLLDDESGKVTDSDIMSAIKKNNIDKLRGFNTIFSDDPLSDVPTNISSESYDTYVQMRHPSESSKQKYGQRKIDEKLQKTKDEIEQRKKDIEQYETIGFDNPYVDEVRNIKINYKLKNYDVKSKVDEYMQAGLTKEAAIAKVREDIHNISNRKTSFDEKILGTISGLGRYLCAPAMYNDYYIETGKEDDAEAFLRAGLGGGLNTLELSPYGKSLPVAAKVASIAAKPVVESIRKNFVDTDKANVKKAIKDALAGVSLNALLNAPAEASNLAKSVAPIVKKLPPVKKMLAGMAESQKIGRDYVKEYKNAEEALMKKMNIDIESLQYPGYEKTLAKGLKDFARKPNNANKVQEAVEELERLGKNAEADYIVNIQQNPAQLVNADFSRFTLGRKADRLANPTDVINSRQRMATIMEEIPAAVMPKEIRKDSKDLLNRAAEQQNLASLKHPNIAKATSEGYTGSVAKAIRNSIVEQTNSYSEIEPYIENIKNDDLALRMWQAGFRPKNLTKRQIEYIDEEINR